MSDEYNFLRRDIGRLNEKLHDMTAQRDYWRAQIDLVKQERDEIAADRDQWRAEVGRLRQMITGIIKTFRHNGRLWHIVRIGQSYFARDDQGSDTGPYHHPEWAEEWVRGIRP